MMNALADTDLHGIVQLGDAFDLETLSSHNKRKPSPNSLAQEIRGGKEIRRDLDSLGTEDKHITLGNHEVRLYSYLMKHAPELYEEMSVDSLFGLSANGWQVHDFMDVMKIGKMHFVHCLDPQMTGINAVRSTGTLAGKSITIGHVHRSQSEYFGKIDNKHFVAHCPGWLGSTKAAEYMSKAKIYSTWMQGFSLISFEDNGNFHLVPVAITDGKCAVNGKLYRG